MKLLNWNNLRSNTCPKCGEVLKERNQFYLECSNKESCDFSISQEKFKKITEK